MGGDRAAAAGSVRAWRCAAPAACVNTAPRIDGYSCRCCSTDNSIKNHWYSTMRRNMRRIAKEMTKQMKTDRAAKKERDSNRAVAAAAAAQSKTSGSSGRAARGSSATAATTPGGGAGAGAAPPTPQGAPQINLKEVVSTLGATDAALFSRCYSLLQNTLAGGPRPSPRSALPPSSMPAVLTSTLAKISGGKKKASAASGRSKAAADPPPPPPVSKATSSTRRVTKRRRPDLSVNVETGLDGSKDPSPGSAADAVAGLAATPHNSLGMYVPDKTPRRRLHTNLLLGLLSQGMASTRSLPPSTRPLSTARSASRSRRKRASAEAAQDIGATLSGMSKSAPSDNLTNEDVGLERFADSFLNSVMSAGVNSSQLALDDSGNPDVDFTEVAQFFTLNSPSLKTPAGMSLPAWPPSSARRKSPRLNAGQGKATRTPRMFRFDDVPLSTPGGAGAASGTNPFSPMALGNQSPRAAGKQAGLAALTPRDFLLSSPSGHGGGAAAGDARDGAPPKKSPRIDIDLVNSSATGEQAPASAGIGNLDVDLMMNLPTPNPTPLGAGAGAGDGDMGSESGASGAGSAMSLGGGVMPLRRSGRTPKSARFAKEMWGNDADASGSRRRTPR